MATGEAVPPGEHADWLEHHDPVLRLGRMLASDGAAIGRGSDQLDVNGRADGSRRPSDLRSEVHCRQRTTAFDHVFA